MRASIFAFTLGLFAFPCLAHAADAPADRPAPEPAPTWHRGGYFGFGIAPSSTLFRDGFAPGLRYDLETGFSWRREKLVVMVGAEGHIQQYYGRKHIAGGADGVVTLGYGWAYVRAGLGTMAAMPTSRDLDRAVPTVGGLVGIGLQTTGDHIAGRFGVDYDLRVDTMGQRIQTVLLVLRVSFG